MERKERISLRGEPTPQDLKRRAREAGESLAQALYSAMKRDIVTCRLPPGLSFTEGWICELYGASRTPVRDACLRLAKDGLLEWVPNKGYSVSPVSLQDLYELFQLRDILETAAVRLACRWEDPEQLGRLEQLGEVGYTLGRRASYLRFIDTDHRFHRLIAGMSRNRRLGRQLDQILVHFERVSFLTMKSHAYGEEIRAEHRAIIEAIRKMRPDEAARAVSEHIDLSKERALRHFQPRPRSPST